MKLMSPFKIIFSSPPYNSSMRLILLFLLIPTSCLSYTIPTLSARNETEAIAFLGRYNAEISRLLHRSTIAEWNYNTNLTEETMDAAIEAGISVSEYNAQAFDKVSTFDMENFSVDTKRQLSKVGSKSLSEDEMKTLSSIISQMGSIYGQAKVCRPRQDENHGQECLSLEPDLLHIMANSRNVTERLWAWDGWRKIVGTQIKPLYVQYVELKNKLAQVNGYQDYGEELRERYEDPEFESDIRRLYEEMKPLYVQLHAYIRRKLFETYGSDVVDINGPLPQHLLGDMWGRFWSNLYSIAVPYPDEPSLDVTPAMTRQNYTVLKMFQTGEQFYTSMGLLPLPSTFYLRSMLEKPHDREVVCHATAWDFFDGKDFRIKMCTKIDFEDLLTIHHELGHIQYFMQYAHQPTVYRDGANDGFHEAVGELMSMCVSTPKHLHAIGLLENLIESNETDINFLFQMALSTVAALPFHYVNDLWRWKVFRGEFPPDSWNQEFWQLFEQVVGVRAPIPRGPGDLDCPTIFHVAQDYDMIRYFTRTILQFQFAESLCQAAGHVGPLHKCDFYGSTAAGDKLAMMLRLGSSKPWQVSLEAITGQSAMNTGPIRRYFEPLMEWLTNTNAAKGDSVGWER